jgi:membrane protease YdiL (CAAX protease family)
VAFAIGSLWLIVWLIAWLMPEPQLINPLFTVASAIVIALTLLASKLLGGRATDVLALRGTPGGWRTYASAVVCTVLVVAPFLAAAAYYVGGGSTGEPGWWSWAQSWLSALIIAPLSEELLFRGLLLASLTRTLGFWGASVVTSLLWTAVHGPRPIFFYPMAFGWGLFFSWLLWRTGSLRVTILCHGLMNLLIRLVLWLAPVHASD